MFRPPSKPELSLERCLTPIMEVKCWPKAPPQEQGSPHPRPSFPSPTPNRSSCMPKSEGCGQRVCFPSFAPLAPLARSKKCPLIEAARSQCLFPKSNRKFQKTVWKPCTSLPASNLAKRMYLLDFCKRGVFCLWKRDRHNTPTKAGWGGGWR